MTRTPPPTVVARFVDCINRGDAVGLGALMTDDHELRVFDEAPLRGKDANVDAWRGYAAAYPTYTIVADEVVEHGGRVAVLGHTTGSHLGLPSEEEQALTLIWLAEVSDGLVRSWTLVEDTRSARQEWGSAASPELSTASRCVCETAPPMPPSSALPDDAPLRIAWLVYRGNPHCGGQGVYTRYLARELADLGHEVTVFSGQPYPELDDPRQLVKVPGLDLYAEPHPFWPPWPWEVKSTIDLREFGIMCGAGFPEPYAFSLRARRILQHRRADFDIVHDNQCLGAGLLTMMHEDDWPVLCTLHHPITVDRDLELSHATSAYRRVVLNRWYGFLKMQMRVARQIPRLVTVSESSRRDIVAQMDVPADRLHIVPVGVDPKIFRPIPGVARVRGRLMTTTSSDVPMKGLAPLLEAVAKVRTERSDVELVIVGKPKTRSAIPALIERLGLQSAVRFVSDVTTERIVELYAEAEVAVVPSLYEGFSLPAVEAMACGVPLVATTGGALPEVVGTHNESGLLVPPGDSDALAGMLLHAFGDAELRSRIGEAGRTRVLDKFTWRATALGTVENYRALLAERAGAR